MRNGFRKFPAGRRCLATAMSLCFIMSFNQRTRAEEDPPRPDSRDFEFVDDTRDSNYFFQRISPETGTLAVTGTVTLAGETGKYWIGVECREVPPELRSQLQLADKQGLLVVRISDDSAAEKAGLKRHDVLMAAGGKKLEHVPDLAKAVNDADGKEVTLNIIRGGKEQSINITPVERPRDVIKFARPGPGMFIPGLGIGPHVELPDNMKVLIQRQGKEPAKITVSRGDDNWEVTEEQLDKLPDDIRPMIEHALGRGPVTLPLPGRPFDAPPGMRVRVEGVSPFGPGGEGQKMRVKVFGPGEHDHEGPPPEGPAKTAPLPDAGPRSSPYLPPGVRIERRESRPAPMPPPPGDFVPEMMKRLDMLDRRLEQMQDEIRHLRGDRPGPAGPAPSERRPEPRGPREGRPNDRDRDDDRPVPAPN